MKDVPDYNIEVVTKRSYSSDVPMEKSVFKLSPSQTIQFEELSSESIDSLTMESYCVVLFRGHFYVIESRYIHIGTILTLYRISDDGNIEKLSEEYVRVSINFSYAKICASGLYQKDDERIMFCSTFESNDICHSFRIEQNSVSLTTIYNRVG